MEKLTISIINDIKSGLRQDKTIDMMPYSEALKREFRDKFTPGAFELDRKLGVEIETWRAACLSERQILDRANALNLLLNFRGLYSGGSAPMTWVVKPDCSIGVRSHVEKEAIKKLHKQKKFATYDLIRSQEFVSPPMTHMGYADLEKVCKLLSTLHATMRVKNKKGETKTVNLYYGNVDPTCGMHVHVSVEEVSNAGREQIAMLYRRLEPQLEKIIPDHRSSGTYVEKVRGKSYGDLVNTGKYSNLNVGAGPRMQDGRNATFEYRAMSSTRNYYNIRYWMTILNSIHNYALGHTRQQIREADLYTVIKNPILWDWINRRVYFMTQSAKYNEKKRGTASKILLETKPETMGKKKVTKKIEGWISTLLQDHAFVEMRDITSGRLLGVSYTEDGLKWVVDKWKRLPYYENAKLVHVPTGVPNVYETSIQGDKRRSSRITVGKFVPRDHSSARLQIAEFFWISKALKMLYFVHD